MYADLSNSLKRYKGDIHTDGPSGIAETSPIFPDYI